MLSCAVLGNVFASPSVSAILSGIRYQYNYNKAPLHSVCYDVHTLDVLLVLWVFC